MVWCGVVEDFRKLGNLKMMGGRQGKTVVEESSGGNRDSLWAVVLPMMVIMVMVTMTYR
jgi:hypothetical protein